MVGNGKRKDEVCFKAWCKNKPIWSAALHGYWHTRKWTCGTHLNHLVSQFLSDKSYNDNYSVDVKKCL